MLFINLYQYTKVFQFDMSSFIYYTNSLTNIEALGQALQAIALKTQLSNKGISRKNYSRGWGRGGGEKPFYDMRTQKLYFVHIP